MEHIKTNDNKKAKKLLLILPISLVASILLIIITGVWISKKKSIALQPSIANNTPEEIGITDHKIATPKPILDTLIFPEYDNLSGHNFNIIGLTKPGDTYSDSVSVPIYAVEVEPKFLGGGIDAFTDWVNAHVVYQKNAEGKYVSGKVIVYFEIDKNGSVSNIKVLHGENYLLDKEAVRVVSLSPKWISGKHHGKSVNVSCICNVVFKPK